MSILSRRHRQDDLVNPKELEGLVDSTLPKPLNEFMKRRWLGMVMWWHTRSITARRDYFLLRLVVVIGGVLIPVLTTMNGVGGWKLDTTLAISLLGATVAACAAWEGVANYGEIWREKRRAAELLKIEGWLYLQQSGKYRPEGDMKSSAQEKNALQEEEGAAQGQSTAQGRSTTQDQNVQSQGILPGQRVSQNRRSPEEHYWATFPLFAAEVESLIAKEIGEYLGAFDPSVAQAKSKAADLIDAILNREIKKYEA